MFQALAYVGIILLLIDGALLYFTRGTDMFDLFVFLGAILLFVVGYMLVLMLIIFVITPILNFFSNIVQIEAHESTETVDTYRFPKIYVKVATFALAFPVIILVWVYVTKEPILQYTARANIAGTALALSASLLFLYAYLYIKRFYVSVNANNIEYRYFMTRTHTIPIRDIGKIERLRLAFAKGYRLSIYRRDGNKVLSVHDTIQDFDDLISTIRIHCQPYHVPYTSQKGDAGEEQFFIQSATRTRRVQEVLNKPQRGFKCDQNPEGSGST
jgi:hypothetical protein